jgi:hypothetical protein
MLDKLRKALDYDPVTGIFRWKINRAKAAREAVQC